MKIVRETLHLESISGVDTHTHWETTNLFIIFLKQIFNIAYFVDFLIAFDETSHSDNLVAIVLLFIEQISQFLLVSLERWFFVLRT